MSTRRTLRFRAGWWPSSAGCDETEREDDTENCRLPSSAMNRPSRARAAVNIEAWRPTAGSCAARSPGARTRSRPACAAPAPARPSTAPTSASPCATPRPPPSSSALAAAPRCGPTTALLSSSSRPPAPSRSCRFTARAPAPPARCASRWRADADAPTGPAARRGGPARRPDLPRHHARARSCPFPTRNGSRWRPPADLARRPGVVVQEARTCAHGRQMTRRMTS